MLLRFQQGTGNWVREIDKVSTISLRLGATYTLRVEHSDDGRETFVLLDTEVINADGSRTETEALTTILHAARP